jgi:hypothetical protein
MRPAVKRRLATLAAAASLVLCVATLALWIRSYRRLDGIDGIRVTDETVGRFAIASLHGSFELSSTRQPVPDAREGHVFVPGYWYASTDYRSPPQPTPRDVAELFGSDGASTGWFLGFGFAASLPTKGSSWRYVWLPHWSLALFFAILPALRLRGAIRSRRRRRAGHCPRCGYDLRATPARCPECGMAVVTA